MFAYTLSKRDGTHPSMGVVPDSLALNGGAITSEATGAEADLRHDGTIIMGTRDDGGGPEGNGPTAQFSDLPRTHDGEKPFKVTLTGCVATSGLRRQDGPPLASTVPGPPSCPATIRSNGASSNPPSSSSAFGGTCGMP